MSRHLPPPNEQPQRRPPGPGGQGPYAHGQQDDEWRPYRPAPYPPSPSRPDAPPPHAPYPQPPPPFGTRPGPAPPANAPPMRGPQPPPPPEATPYQPDAPQPYAPPSYGQQPYGRQAHEKAPLGEPAPEKTSAIGGGRLKRRLIELGVVLILVPVTVGLRWYDDSNHAVTRKPHERVTVVPHGAAATFGRNRWRMLGRQDQTGRPLTRASAPGAAQLTLLLEVKVLDAKGSKGLDHIEYRVRDREGHQWTASGNVENPSVDAEEVPVGSTTRVKVTATVPKDRLSSLVLDLHIRPFDREERTVLHVLRFAH